MKEVGGTSYCKYCGDDFPVENTGRGRPPEFCSDECRDAKANLDHNRNEEIRYEKKKKAMSIRDSYYARSLAKSSYKLFCLWVEESCLMTKEEEIREIYEELKS